MLRRKIALVDNDLIHAKEFEIQLSRCGYRVEIYYDIEKFGSAVDGLQPDIIIIDSSFLQNEAENVSDELGQILSCRHIPVIVLSPLSKPVLANSTCKIECFLTKPFNLLETIGTIEACLD